MSLGSSGPALWSAEEPNLYILVLSLIAPDGSHVESESCQVRKLQQQTLLSFCEVQMALEQVQVKWLITKPGWVATTVSLSGVVTFWALQCAILCVPYAAPPVVSAITDEAAAFGTDMALCMRPMQHLQAKLSLA